QLRKVLYFWTADAVGKGILGRNQSPPLLAPFAGGAAVPGAAASPLAAPVSLDDVAATARARSVIRIAALARQWQAANRSVGYLLTGNALKEAAQYRDADPEIRAFIDASEAGAARTRNRNWQLLFLLALVLAAILGYGYWTVSAHNADLTEKN